MNTPLFSSSTDSAPTKRVVTVFADLVDSTSLARRLPLAQFTTLMTELLQVMMLHTEARGGWALSHHGDGLLSVWEERDAPFALEAAVECHSRAARLSVARRLGLKLQLRVGVATGEVMLCSVGRELTAYGLPLIMARRLCDAGDPGQTLVCQGMRELLPQAALQALPAADYQGFEGAQLSYLCGAPNLTANTMKMKHG